MTNINLESRIRGMIWGQLIGDAFCLGTHWIYNLHDLKTFYPELQGFEVPRPGHYHEGKEPGAFTHYGDAALLLLESVAQSGHLDVVDFGRRFVAHYGSRDYKGYLDSATRGTLEKASVDAEGQAPEGFAFQSGADDDQLATATSLAPVVACYHDSPELGDRVAEATRVRQNHPRSIAYMVTYAQILAALLKGTDLHSAVHQVQETAVKHPEFGPELAQRFKDVFERKHLDTVKGTEQLGQSCPLKNSFPAALLAVVQTPDDFTDTLRRIAAAGGDNAGRATIAGALLGAHLGIDAIPEALRNNVSAKERIDAAIEKVIEATCEK
ncbi:MAG: ADP-ribosylglycohydrolase family protein [Verrucomicrobia bacterium]|jgi:ADP-ribosylglycohydrolase|nr:ADP-ribosylglycohydrolase family protein [Verrucomicrobiota bacterium]